jgi:NADH:ubiquinone oxidoreductase subunit K
MTVSCATCSSALEEDSRICPNCGTEVAVPAVDAEAVPATAPIFKSFNDRSDLNGIGGWLVLPAIGLAISPFICLGPLFVDIQLLISGDHPSLFANHPSLTELLIFEIIINAVTLAAVIGLNFLFYTKKRIFPRCIIALYAAQCVLVLADHLAASAVFPSANLSAGVFGVVRSFIVAAVWIPYFLNSVRVEQTFVN